MSVLTKEQYAEVQREIESRAIHYHGQIGADVDWLLTQVRFYRLQVDVLTADVAKLREALVAVVDADHDTDNDGVHYVDFKKNWPPCEACKAIERARDVLAATAPKEPPCP